MDELRRIFEWLEIALWWLDEVLILLSFFIGIFGVGVMLSGYEGYKKILLASGLIGVWAIYSLLWSV